MKAYVVAFLAAATAIAMLLIHEHYENERQSNREHAITGRALRAEHHPR